MRRWLALWIALCLAGCVTVPMMPVPPVLHAALPPDWAGYYGYSPAPLTLKTERLEHHSGYTFQRLTLSGPAHETGDPVLVDWWRPDRPGRHPAVLMSPILAGNDLYVGEFARFYAARGLHAVLVYRKKERFSADRPLTDIEHHLRDSILRLRRTLDWLETEESVDPKRIGSFAISLGAILTAILAAVEPRLRCSVLGLPAGRVSEILMTSQDKAIRKHRRNYLKEKGISTAQLGEQLKGVLRSEPLAFAPAVDPKRILMIGGLFDRTLGLGRTLELWRAMGRPQLILLPTGHYTAYLATPYLKIATYSFLRRQLRRTDPADPR